MKFLKGILTLSLLITAPAFAEVSLKGSGSVLAAPLLTHWVNGYRQAQPQVRLKYEQKNSADGIRQFLDRGSDFAVSDTPLAESEGKKSSGPAFLHLPVALEAVAITYNLPGVQEGIRLSPEVLSKIFKGALKKWNDPAITSLNPETLFPNMEILVLHREEESTLHDLFPYFLAQLDPQWTTKREKGKSLKWPVGQNVKGNDQVVEKMKKWPGGIAAVDFSYAFQNHLPLAALKNEAGRFVQPTKESLEAAVSGRPDLPEDLKMDLTQSHSPKAYPLCAFSYLLVYQDYLKTYHDPKRGKALADFLDWILAEGQKLEVDLGYAPLPATVDSQVKEKVLTIKY